MPVLGAWQLRGAKHELQTPGGLRPLAVEVIFPVALAALYWWEVECQGLVRALAPPGFIPAATDQLALHAAFSSHVILLAFMLVASLVDVDEQVIPDLVTLPGTLVGLVLAAIFPISLLPVVVPLKGAPVVSFLTLAGPRDAAPLLAPDARWTWLVVGLVCFAGWCAALLPWRLRVHRGWRRAGNLLVARWVRDSIARLVAVTAVAGSACIVAVWSWGGDHWIALLSAAGRIGRRRRLDLGGASGRRLGPGAQAMGFGDVTLMAMIGSFLGWQAGPIVFFLAPVAGLVVGLAQWFLYRDNVIPYGPFLCLAATVVIVDWGPIWDWALPLYAVPWLVPVALAACLAMLAILLRLWRGIRTALGGER